MFRVMLFGLGLLGFGFDRMAVGLAPPTHPNLVLLLLDDLQDEQYLPFWDAMPDLAPLARKGTWFKNAFGPSPICCPGRVTTLSGLYGHNSGVMTIAKEFGAERFREGDKLKRTFPVFLQRQGYQNALVGKSWKMAEKKLSSTTVDPGWCFWSEMGGARMYRGEEYFLLTWQRSSSLQLESHSGPGHYSTFVLGEKAESFIRKGWNPKQGPFFLWLSPTAPHLPLQAPDFDRYGQPSLLRAEALRRWPPETFPDSLIPNFGIKDPLEQKPSWLRREAPLRERFLNYPKEEYPRRMGSLLAFNQAFKDFRRVLESVKYDDKTSAFDHTVFILTSDNGYNNGAHRLIHKMAPYEESLRVPLYVFGQGIAEREVEQMVGLMDLAPTFIELGGGAPPQFMDGRSFAPLLDPSRNPNSVAWRNRIVGEYRTGGVAAGEHPEWALRDKSLRRGWQLDVASYDLLRTERYSYIEWLATGERELYDVQNDKWQMHNLLLHPSEENKQLLRELDGDLQILKNCSGRLGVKRADGSFAKVPCP